MNEYSYSERHMGTDTTVSLIMDDRKKSERLAKQTFSVINTYETLFSRFLSDSELSILNRTGSHIVCEEFIDVLECSLELSRLTKGGLTLWCKYLNLATVKIFLKSITMEVKLKMLYMILM